ncbi:formate dehydrogenase accessory sulfurtransferase FdhD [Pseudomonas sp. M30-35]|uniref:formate dehydrogenase accessory sulfurtransferase FdhD n=1 Tax=Pseudomonas sp. M30-35 TaxID=1981174 RepID=UPI000B3CCCD6|nr:formate dehydrogenase accessory sulfurtransferase FdhD [Pseudomonas sp. M30-35]ARU90220.1 sulfurtransferase FdhD [Pseudomonas sp. M30-35]
MPPAKPNKDIAEITTSPTDYSYAELTADSVTDAVTLADECALAISYNGINHAVMMVSPSFVEDFITGFSLSNALIDASDEIYDIQLERKGDALNAQVTLSNRAFWALKEHRRQLAGTSGCGLCGVEALDQALPALKPLPISPLPPAEHLIELRQRIGAQQQLGRTSGALHAALLVDAQGEIQLCREDIGRHNALDKLIGALQNNAIDTQHGFAVITSRCSLELIQKAVRAGIRTLVSLSAPTALSVQWARRHNLNLIHLPHHSSPRVFSPAPTRPSSR